MAFEHREMTGTLFKNKHKKEDKHPDYKGECKINGELYEMAAWIKDGKNGKFMSFSFSEPRESGSGNQDATPANDSPF